MPAQINGLNYYELAFRDDGSFDTSNGPGDGGLPAAVAAGGIEDVFIFCHGWNSSVDSARALYRSVFGSLAGMLGDRLGKSAAVGVLWPSLLFPDDDPATAPPMPSSGAALAAALTPAFAAPLQPHLAAIGTLLDEQPQDSTQLDQFHTLARALVTTPEPATDSQDDNQQAALTASTATLLGNAATLAPGGAANAQGLGNPFKKLWGGAREALRSFSYYEMKNRAGVVGRMGLGPLIGGLAGPTGAPRVYLMGHSFGARLAAFSVAGLPATATGTASPVKLLYLIQGAFSHFAFADPMPIDAGRHGELSGFADRVDGPLLATFTRADRAVGVWYPAASLLQRQDDQGWDDLMFEWGGMGHDGYQQHGTTTMPLGAARQSYGFSDGGFYLLDANAIICANQNPFAGAHSDICHDEVVWPIADVAVVAAARG